MGRASLSSSLNLKGLGLGSWRPWLEVLCPAGPAARDVGGIWAGVVGTEGEGGENVYSKEEEWGRELC